MFSIVVEEHNLSIAAAVVLGIRVAYSWIPLAERKEDEPFPKQISCTGKSL
ncbi:MAG: hypothetical protein AB7D06_02345 [Pedobacter sp.]